MIRSALSIGAVSAGVGLFLMSSPFPLLAAPPVPNKQKDRPLFTKFGDITIVRSKDVQWSPDFSSVILRGPNTLITVPDKPSKSLLKLHADDIRMHTDKNSAGNIGTIDMTGHVRYTIVRDAAEGLSTVQGTAGEGHFRRAEHLVTLTHGVNATLTDPVHLNGPGTLQAEKINVDIENQPYLYRLEGTPASNTIRFTPLSKEGATQIGQITIHRYLTGFVQMGETARFEGPATMLEMATTDATTHAVTRSHLQAEQIVARYAADKKTLQETQAIGNVSYRVARPSLDGTTLQTLNGVCNRALWNTTSKQISLLSSVDAQLTDPDSLQEPATLRGDRVLISMEKPYRYEIFGPPERNVLEFMPLPPKPHIPAPVKPVPATTPAAVAPTPATTTAPAVNTAPAPVANESFDFGRVQVTGFDTATFAQNKEFAFVGDRTRLLSSNPHKGTIARLEASHITGSLGPYHTLERTEAVGNVRFFVQRPAPSGKAKQSVQGTGKRALFTHSEPDSDLKIYGPFQAEVIDPDHLAAPGHIREEADGMLTLTQTESGYDVDFNTDNETGVVDFIPLEQPKKTPVAHAKTPKSKQKPAHPKSISPGKK